MKKFCVKILSFVLIFCSIFLCACDEETNNSYGSVTSLAVSCGSTDYVLDDKTIKVKYTGSEILLDDFEFTVVATYASGVQKLLSKDTKGYKVTTTIPSDEATKVGTYKIVFEYGLAKQTVSLIVEKQVISLANSFWYDTTKNVENVTSAVAVDFTYDEATHIYEIYGIDERLVDIAYTSQNTLKNVNYDTATSSVKAYNLSAILTCKDPVNYCFDNEKSSIEFLKQLTIYQKSIKNNIYLVNSRYQYTGNEITLTDIIVGYDTILGDVITDFNFNINTGSSTLSAMNKGDYNISLTNITCLNRNYSTKNATGVFSWYIV